MAYPQQSFYDRFNLRTSTSFQENFMSIFDKAYVIPGIYPTKNVILK